MASLTHVCMWSDNGWKRITAEQAARLHPGGTVSAHSGLFMCELCGQYVILTDGDIRIRYFKHSAYEKSKDCPERTFGAGYSISYGSQEHDLPIRITSVSSSSFSFEVGLIRAPISSLGKDFCIEIKPKGAFDIPYVYTKERLNYDSITYLPIGERPFEKYTLSFQNGNDKLREFWPAEIKGIDPEGTLFEKVSGKKLSYDADVEIGKEYYLLKRGYIYRKSFSSVRIQEIMQKRIGWETWSLYVVSASAFNEDAARFYLDFHCRLTDHPISLQPVWPLFVEGNYIVKHNQNSMYMLIEGNVAAVKTFPSVTVRQLNYNSSQSKLYEVFCSGRQQLISAGRTQALQYTYLWKEPLDQVGLHPEVSVTDIAGAEVDPGETDTLPHDKTLRFKSTFDGELIIFNNNRVVDKRKLSADKYIELNGLSYGLGVQVVIGLDVIWQIDFKKQQPSVVNDESLTEQQALSIAIVNVDKPFIAMWVNTRVDIWLKEIQENIEELEEEGSTHDIALASTMLDSVFANNVDLYLKLAGKTMDVDARSKLHERMESIKSERARNAEVADRIKVLEEEKRRLLDQIAAAQQSVNTIKAEYEQKIQELEQDKDTLESLLAEAQERITELQTAPTAAKSDDADYLAQFDDTDTSVLPSVGSDEIVSLCGVISDYNGQKWLVRHADLSHNGHYHIFRKSEDVPPYFTNRDKIFYKDGPSNDGFYGIWTWSATPNEKDPSKDYILSRYNMDLDAIEVVTISEASNLDNLINLLKNGIEYQPHSHRVMFAFYASKG